MNWDTAAQLATVFTLAATVGALIYEMMRSRLERELSTFLQLVEYYFQIKGKAESLYADISAEDRRGPSPYVFWRPLNYDNPIMWLYEIPSDVGGLPPRVHELCDLLVRAANLLNQLCKYVATRETYWSTSRGTDDKSTILHTVLVGEIIYIQENVKQLRRARERLSQERHIVSLQSDYVEDFNILDWIY